MARANRALGTIELGMDGHRSGGMRDMRCDKCGQYRPKYAVCEFDDTLTESYESCLNWKPITNADRIRAMTDEELAEWGATLPCCPPAPDLVELCFPQNVCENTDFVRQCWLNWLKQEVKG